MENPLVSPEKPLEPAQQQLHDLFRGSFQFSQGGSTLQKNINGWLVAEGYYDGLPIESEPPDYIRQIRPPQLHEIKGEEESAKVIEEEWDALREKIDSKATIYSDDLIPEILTGMIERDCYFLDGGNEGLEGRLNRSPDTSVPPDSQEDPFGSMVRAYILNNVPARVPALQNLIDTMKPVLKGALTDFERGDRQDPLVRKLGPLMSKWEERHPGHKFLPEPKS